MEGHFVITQATPSSNGNGLAPQVRVTAEPELRAQKVPQIYRAQLTVQSSRGPQFVDITDLVQELLDKTGIQEGNVLVYSKHTTAAIIINEHEPLLIQDIYAFLDRLASESAVYSHNDFSVRTVNLCEDECENGHSHCQHLTLGTSETVPIMAGRLELGRWQRIFMVELDRPRERNIVLQFFGTN